MNPGKQNGIKAEKGPAHPGAGDDGASDASDSFPVVVYPENIQKRLNALKNLHMDAQKIDLEMHSRLFQIEAEYHKKMVPFLEKRTQIITGAHEPAANETKFELKEGEPIPETTPSDGKKGIEHFWLQVLLNCQHTGELIEEHDNAALEHLVDVRAVYDENPLGFKLDFEFEENPFFSNKVLSRSYVFQSELSRDDLYLNSGLSPKSTQGTVIEWKEGKNLTKKETTTHQRNKKSGERRQIKKVVDQESFFKFFTPAVTDLSSILKVPEAGDVDHTENIEKIQDAEMDYELACLIRSRLIPRALLFYTGEEEEEMSYSDEEYDEEDDNDDEDDDDDEENSGGAGKKKEESDSDDDDDSDHPPANKKGGAGGKGPAAIGKGAGGGGKHGGHGGHAGHRH